MIGFSHKYTTATCSCRRHIPVVAFTIILQWIVKYWSPPHCDYCSIGRSSGINLGCNSSIGLGCGCSILLGIDCSILLGCGCSVLLGIDCSISFGCSSVISVSSLNCGRYICLDGISGSCMCCGYV